MKKLLLLACVLILPVLAHAQGDFTRNLTAEERAATGLDRLTPEELARLKEVVERYKTGEVAVVRQQAEQKVAATEAKAKQAEQKAAVAEAKVKEVETKAAVATTEPKKKGPGWLTALITLDKVSKDTAHAEAVESRLAGDFKGWRRNTVFTLENGQRWQSVDTQDYVTPPMPPLKVKVYPGALGSFWMEFEGINSRVRVKPLKLE